MNKKGFTLVELLGVITLLGIIMGLMFPPLLTQLKKTSNSIDEATKSVIITGAKNFVEENKNGFPKINGEYYCIEFQELVDENKISKTSPVPVITILSKTANESFSFFTTI